MFNSTATLSRLCPQHQVTQVACVNRVLLSLVIPGSSYVGGGIMCFQSQAQEARASDSMEVSSQKMWKGVLEK
jgi:hypothetical protein